MPQTHFDRDSALAIADALTPLGVNVAIFVVADRRFQPVPLPPTPDNSVPELPLYQIDLSRNADLDAAKVAEIAATLEGHEATVQFPSMMVVGTKPDPEPESAPIEPDASGGGAVADEATGELVEPPQAQPADLPDTPAPEPSE
jgi:hypothetical protein